MKMSDIRWPKEGTVFFKRLTRKENSAYYTAFEAKTSITLTKSPGFVSVPPINPLLFGRDNYDEVTEDG